MVKTGSTPPSKKGTTPPSSPSGAKKFNPFSGGDKRPTLSKSHGSSSSDDAIPMLDGKTRSRFIPGQIRVDIPSSDRKLDMNFLNMAALGPTPPITPKTPQKGIAKQTSWGGTGKYFGLQRQYAPLNDFKMPIQHPWRHRALCLVDSALFDSAIFLIIPFNALCLALWDPSSNPGESDLNTALQVLEIFFLLCFTYEMLLKMFAMGTISHRLSYLRNPWNILDFVTTICGWGALCLPPSGFQNLLKVLRIFRPLRALQVLPELKRLTSAVWMAIPQLLTLALLDVFCFLVFALLGVSMLSGKLRQRCFKTVGGFWEDTGDVPMLCSMNRHYGRQCPPGYECRDYGESPNYNITKFDDILFAFLTIFQIMTMENWTQDMYWARQTVGAWIQFYFVFVLVIGAFFLFNLIIVIIIVNYSLSHEKNTIDSIKEGRVSLLRDNTSQLHNAIITPNDSDMGRKARGAKDDDYNELMISKVTAIKAAAKLEILTSLKVNDDVSSQIAEVALLLRRSLKHLQLAPQNTLDPRLFANPTYERSRDKISYSEAPIKYICVVIAHSSYFPYFINAMILANTVTLSLARYNMDPATQRYLAGLNTVIIATFALEAYIKVRGLGWLKFKQDSMNTFDLIIIIVSLFESIVDGVNSTVTPLRSIRLLRIFSLARSWKSFRHVLYNMAYTANNITPFFILLGICWYIFAVAGMNLFGGRLWHVDPVTGKSIQPRDNYNNFYWAMVSTFHIFTLDKWNDNMYEAMQVTHPAFAVLFFVSAVLLGKYVILNLMLAILVDSYSEIQEEEVTRKLLHAEKSHPSVCKRFVDFIKSRNFPISSEKSPVKALTPTSAFTAIVVATSGTSPKNVASPTARSPKSPMTSSTMLGDISQYFHGSMNSIRLFKNPNHQQHASESTGVPQSMPPHNTCSGPVRNLLKLGDQIYGHRYFSNFIVYFIILSCIMISFDASGQSLKGPEDLILHAINIQEILFLLVFGFDQVFRARKHGILKGEGAYLTLMWDWFDLSIIITAILCIAVPQASPLMPTLKLIRGLRPLTLIERVMGLQVVFCTLAQAMNSISSVLFVAFIFYLMFAIIAVDLFGGTFYSCNDPTKTCYPYAPGLDPDACPKQLQCVGKFHDPTSGQQIPRQWTNPQFSPSSITYSFDDVPSGLVALFEVAGQENWVDFMWSAVDAVSPGIAPRRDHNPYNAVFFIVFLMIVAFFVQEIFVAVIINNFQKIKGVSNGSAFMTARQKEWVRLQKTIRTQQPKIHARPPPNQRLRGKLFDFVKSQLFETLSIAVILANITCMSTQHFSQSRKWYRYLDNTDIVFTILYFIEVFLKVLALGFSSFWVSRWNRVDMLIVVWSILALILLEFKLPSDTVLLVLRICRVFRIFRLVRLSERLQRLVKTFYYSLPSLRNVGMCLLLILYIYGNAGMHLFAAVPFDTFNTVESNFRDFPHSFMMLVRVSTGESWNGVMREVASESSVAIPFFCSFIVIINYIMLNLLIATLLENFEEDLTSLIVKTTHIRSFSKLWAESKKKSLRGDLTKIDNRRTKVSTPVLRRTSTIDLFTQLSGRSSVSEVASKLFTLSRNDSSKGSGGPTPTPSMPKHFNFRPHSGPSTEHQDKHDKDREKHDREMIFHRLYESSPRYLPIQYLLDFLLRLPPPLGPKACYNVPTATRAIALRYMHSLEIPVNRYCFVYYQEVLQAVVRRTYEIKATLAHQVRQPSKSKKIFYAHEYYAAALIQSCWRGNSLRKNLPSMRSKLLQKSSSIVDNDNDSGGEEGKEHRISNGSNCRKEQGKEGGDNAISTPQRSILCSTSRSSLDGDDSSNTGTGGGAQEHKPDLSVVAEEEVMSLEDEERILGRGGEGGRMLMFSAGDETDGSEEGDRGNGPYLA